MRGPGALWSTRPTRVDVAGVAEVLVTDPSRRSSVDQVERRLFDEHWLARRLLLAGAFGRLSATDRSHINYRSILDTNLLLLFAFLVAGFGRRRDRVDVGRARALLEGGSGGRGVHVRRTLRGGHVAFLLSFDSLQLVHPALSVGHGARVCFVEVLGPADLLELLLALPDDSRHLSACTTDAW